MELKKLTKKIALSALAALYGTTHSAPANINAISDENFNDRNGNVSADKPTLLLKKAILDYNRFLENPASHRSHRSHSSHRSHYSSSSGSRTYTKPSSKSQSGSSSSSSSGSRVYTPTYTPTYSTPITTYSLGDRVLKQGMTGDDIKELNSKLYQKGYLSSPRTFSSSFDGTTALAVKKFQKDYGLTVDGIAGQTTILYLKYDLAKPSNSATENISNNKTFPSSTSTQTLGERVLKFGMEGQDVKELKEYLVNLGYLKQSDFEFGKLKFDQKTKEAVQYFQRAKRISVDGIVGRTTLQYLKTESKAISSFKDSQSDELKNDKEEGKEYYIKIRTSLKKSGNPYGTHLQWLSAGDKVLILNSVSNNLWWKVRDSSSGQIGWISPNSLRR